MKKNKEHNGKDAAILSVKLSRETRNSFKVLSKQIHNCAMQDILRAFIQSYISDPQQFQVRVELTKVNGGSHE
jgi:predicted DNA-binding protein